MRAGAGSRDETTLPADDPRGRRRGHLAYLVRCSRRSNPALGLIGGIALLPLFYGLPYAAHLQIRWLDGSSRAWLILKVFVLMILLATLFLWFLVVLGMVLLVVSSL